MRLPASGRVGPRGVGVGRGTVAPDTALLKEERG